MSNIGETEDFRFIAGSSSSKVQFSNYDIDDDLELDFHGSSEILVEGKNSESIILSEIIPDVSAELKPCIGKTFKKYDEVERFYREYAKACGFGVRLGTLTKYDDLSMHKRHIRCNRYGKRKPRTLASSVLEDSQIQQRKSYTQQCGCGAMIGINRDRVSNVYSIYTFQEAHNHEMNKSINEEMIEEGGKLNYSDHQFIAQSSTLKIGASKAHNFKSAYAGGYQRFKPTKNAYKNFWRDYINIVGPNDAQCVVNQMKNRADYNQDFFFQYQLKDKELHSMIWIDEEAKNNYSRFSDVISLDGTYRTNRYNMIFVPFTAINHHQKNINIGAALLGDEKIETYSWMLQKFIEANVKAPTLLLTDQDPALCQAIANVLPNTKHRLCMWHIMTKMTSKLSPTIASNKDFKKKIHKLVWSIHLDPQQFEQQWEILLDEFDLRSNKWMHDMYAIRDKWIPAYFREFAMCGIMKTTSRSESSNSFFNLFSSPTNLLVNSMINFDTAIAKQRHDHRILDMASNNTNPNTFITSGPLQIELDAAKIYTKSVFTSIQKEIKKAYHYCFQKTMEMVDETQLCTIISRSHKSTIREEFQVRFDEKNHIIHCSCEKFHHFGILCCHAFRVLINNDISMIPEQYVLPRWKKNFSMTTKKSFIKEWGVCNTETSMLVQEASQLYEACINKVAHNKEKLQMLISRLQALKLECEEECVNDQDPKDMESIIKDVFGIEIPEVVVIETPKGIKNKGGWRKTRLRSTAEKVKTKYLRRKRTCTGCWKKVHHDRRNCPINPSKGLKPRKKKGK